MAMHNVYLLMYVSEETLEEQVWAVFSTKEAAEKVGKAQFEVEGEPWWVDAWGVRDN